MVGSYQRLLEKVIFTSYLFSAQHERFCMGKRNPASLLVILKGSLAFTRQRNGEDEHCTNRDDSIRLNLATEYEPTYVSE